MLFARSIVKRKYFFSLGFHILHIHICLLYLCHSYFCHFFLSIDCIRCAWYQINKRTCIYVCMHVYQIFHQCPTSTTNVASLGNGGKNLALMRRPRPSNPASSPAIGSPRKGSFRCPQADRRPKAYGRVTVTPVQKGGDSSESSDVRHHRVAQNVSTCTE